MNFRFHSLVLVALLWATAACSEVSEELVAADQTATTASSLTPDRLPLMAADATWGQAASEDEYRSTVDSQPIGTVSMPPSTSAGTHATITEVTSPSSGATVPVQTTVAQGLPATVGDTIDGSTSLPATVVPTTVAQGLPATVGDTIDGSTSLPATEAPAAMPPQDVLMHADFDAEPAASSGLSRSDLERIFGLPLRYASNSSSLRIVDGSLVQSYQPTAKGSARTQFPTKPLGTNSELWLTYDVMFEPGFEWVLGGKLPGLAGGTVPTGGVGGDGTDGFSARLAWRSGGRLVVYAYHPGRPSVYGEDFPIAGTFETGRWYRIVQRVALNSEGNSDGQLEVWVDGERRLNRSDLQWRTTGSFSVDTFVYSSFYGGNTPEWAPEQTTAVRFDNFLVTSSSPVNLRRPTP